MGGRRGETGNRPRFPHAAPCVERRPRTWRLGGNRPCRPHATESCRRRMSDARFSSLARLFGNEALDRLSRAHVAVIGVGGVGSWTVEALARSGVGALTLVDMDDVCVTNINRQLPALVPTVG